jgi:hypothetical protein
MPCQSKYVDNIASNRKNKEANFCASLWSVFTIVLSKYAKPHKVSESRKVSESATFSIKPFCSSFEEDVLGKEFVKIFNDFSLSLGNKKEIKNIEDVVTFVLNKKISFDSNKIEMFLVFYSRLRELCGKVKRDKREESFFEGINQSITAVPSKKFSSKNVYIAGRTLENVTIGDLVFSNHITICYMKSLTPAELISFLNKLNLEGVSPTLEFKIGEAVLKDGKIVCYTAYCDELDRIFGEKTYHISVKDIPNPGENAKLVQDLSPQKPATFETTIKCLFTCMGVEEKYSFDLDGTLVQPKNNADFSLTTLTSASAFTNLMELTELGKNVFELCKLIPDKVFITTSRTKPSLDVIEAISEMTNISPKNISFGERCSIKLGKERDESLAINKAGRVPGLIHFDDVKVVTSECSKRGIYSLHYTEGKLFLSLPEEVEGGKIVHLSVSGIPGAGKTTFIHSLISYLEEKSFLEEKNLEKSFLEEKNLEKSFLEEKNLKEKSLECYLFSPDMGDKTAAKTDSLFCPAGKTKVFIHDSVGFDSDHSGKIHISFSTNITTLLGSLISVFDRKNHQSISSSEEKMDDYVESVKNRKPHDKNRMNVIEMFNYYLRAFEGNLEMVKNAFANANYNMRYKNYTNKNSFSTVSLTYREGSQFWSIWGRQARKIQFILSDGKIIYVRQANQAGCEIKAENIKSSGDLYSSRLSGPQQIISNLMNYGSNPDELKLTLSSKKDGQTCLFSFFTTKEHYDLFLFLARQESQKEVSSSFEEDFNVMLIEETWKMSGGKFGVFMSSGGTLFASGKIIPSFITAFAGQFDIEINPSQTTQEVWQKCISALFSGFSKYFEKSVEKNFTIFFEAFCKNNQTAEFKNFPSYSLDEIAVSSKRSGAHFFGSISTIGEFIPHFDQEDLVNESGFEQPAFYRTNVFTQEMQDFCQKNFSVTVTQDNFISCILDILELYSLSVISAADFYKICAPSNRRQEKSFDEPTPEGFILYALVGGKWDSNKLKTVLYYLAHKPGMKNLDILFDLIRNNLEKKNQILAIYPKLSFIFSMCERIPQIDFSIFTFQMFYEQILSKLQPVVQDEKFENFMKGQDLEYPKLFNAIYGNRKRYVENIEFLIIKHFFKICGFEYSSEESILLQNTSEESILKEDCEIQKSFHKNLCELIISLCTSNEKASNEKKQIDLVFDIMYIFSYFYFI